MTKAVLPMMTTAINVPMPAELRARVDALAQHSLLTRTAVARLALRAGLPTLEERLSATKPEPRKDAAA